MLSMYASLYKTSLISFNIVFSIRMTLSSKFFPLYMRVMPAVSVTVSSSAGKFGFAA